MQQRSIQVESTARSGHHCHFHHFPCRKGNCIFVGLTSKIGDRGIVKYLKADIVCRSTWCSLHCFARSVVPEIPQGTKFPKLHRNFDKIHFPRESRITFSWGWTETGCFHFTTNILWPYIIYFLCLNSPSALWLLSNTLWSDWTVWHWRLVEIHKKGKFQRLSEKTLSAPEEIK